MLENRPDRERTLAAKESGELLNVNRRTLKNGSYISVAGHYYLKGADASKRKRDIYERDGGRCRICGRWDSLEGTELDHIVGGLGPQRCWCAHNLRTLCRGCHRSKHVRVMWSKKNPQEEAAC